MTGETFTCAVCGGEYDLDQRREFDDQDLCPDCLEQETETCSVCGERIWSDNNAGDSDTPLCQSCYERLYTNCTRCGALIPNVRVFYAWDDVGNEEPLCRDCYSRSTRPKAMFFRTFRTRTWHRSPRTAPWTNTTRPSTRATPSPSAE